MNSYCINEKEIIAECKKRGIKQPNTVFRWLRRNPNKTIDDFIAYRKSNPNSNNIKVCKEKNLNYNTVRQWINRKEGRTADDFINREPYLTQKCKEKCINYKNASKWLSNHKDRTFDDYVKYLNEKASKKVSYYRRKISNEALWLRSHPEATNEDYIKHLKRVGKVKSK